MGWGDFDILGDLAGNYVGMAGDMAGDIAGSFINNQFPGLAGEAMNFATDNVLGFAKSGVSKLTGINMSAFGYIVDTVTKKRLIFQYNVVPRESGGAEYAEQICLGRSVPHLHYKGGKVRTLELPITFTMKQHSREDVRKSIRWLQSLIYPDYMNGKDVSRAPHPVVVVQGRMYQQDVWVVRDYSIVWGDALDPDTQIPHEATINLTLTELSMKGKSSNDVIQL